MSKISTIFTYSSMKGLDSASERFSFAIANFGPAPDISAIYNGMNDDPFGSSHIRIIPSPAPEEIEHLNSAKELALAFSAYETLFEDVNRGRRDLVDRKLTIPYDQLSLLCETLGLNDKQERCPHDSELLKRVRDYALGNGTYLGADIPTNSLGLGEGACSPN